MATLLSSPRQLPNKLTLTVSSPSGATTAIPLPSPRLTPRKEVFSPPHIPAPPLRRSENYTETRSSISWALVVESPAFWIASYFAVNMGLTLLNKRILTEFPYPYTLTGFHSAFCIVGTLWAWKIGTFAPTMLTPAQDIKLALFSVLYTVNIALSNISLRLVTVAFHEVVRASSPLFTILVAWLILDTRGRGVLGVGKARLLSLVPVMVGVALATYGDYNFTQIGLLFTLLGTFVAATKSVVLNVIQTSNVRKLIPLPVSSPPRSSRGGGDGDPPEYPVPGPKAIKLHPLDLLLRMAPLALIQCVAYAYASGEVGRMKIHGVDVLDKGHATVLFLNGCTAFAMNVVSLAANKKAGPLAMAVAANVKQVLTIAMAIFLFNLHVSPTHCLGILLTLMGGAWYGSVEYREKMR